MDKARTELKEWKADVKREYNILMGLPLKKLQHLGKMGGLDMTHYKTKDMISKGLMIRLNSILPVNFP